LLHDFAHLTFGFVDFVRDGAETFGESIGFFLEQRVAGLGTFQAGFGGPEGLTGGENGLALTFA